MRCTVLGAGSWGTALGSVLAGKGFPVTLWDVDQAVVAAVADLGENTRYLPGVALPASLTAGVDLATALDGAELVVFVVPSQVMRTVAAQAQPYLRPGALLVSAAKGIDVDTLQTMSEVLKDALDPVWHDRLTFLSGPSFAREVAVGLPTVVTIAAQQEAVARQVQEAFRTATFRTYYTTDVVGVEIGGCVKNVVAIAAGIADGLGFGSNSRAALITRGLAEITRLAVCLGAQPATLAGLSGLGDLVLTCSSEQSRNHTVGVELGRGRALDDITAGLGQVAEGVLNARSTKALAERSGVSMPICEAVYAVLYEGFSPNDAVVELMTREPKPEHAEPAR
jgi:glycerol-3-phosphate dehydrogenase (NAD(P)+)